jgi:hypothetical protein
LVCHTREGIVFGTRVLRRVFGSARESNRRVQNFQNETFQNLHISPDIKVIKLRGTRWSGTDDRYTQNVS